MKVIWNREIPNYARSTAHETLQRAKRHYERKIKEETDERNETTNTT